MATATKKKPAAKKSPEVYVSLGTFDTGPPILRIARTAPISDYVKMTTADYQPRGGTPLRDATAQFVGHLESLRKPDRLVIGMLADESGSMYGNRAAVIAGFNDFIAGLADVKKVDPESAGKVLCVIFTDGLENQSCETSPEALAALIKGREADGWTFIFMGANIDAWGTGASIGLSGSATGQSVNFVSSSRGTTAAMGDVTQRTSSYLSSNATFGATYDAMANTSLAEDGVITTPAGNAVIMPKAPEVDRTEDIQNAIDALKGK